MALKDTVVGYTDESGVQLPPLHPRCRCAIDYREVEKPQAKPLTSPQSTGNVGGKPRDALPAPQIQEPLPTVKPNITPLPNGTGACENFAALKLYWLNHYGVRFDEAIADLHFESVRAALSGVEAVINEFLPAGKFLKEFGVVSSGVMCVSHGYTRINFNPDYFADAEKLAANLETGKRTGYYIKNMNIVSAGAHEAGHLVEKWLSENGLTAESVILAAYGAALKTLGELTSLKRLRKEISGHSLKKGIPECLADAISDYITNSEIAALLSRETWHVLKGKLEGKMIAFSESKLAQYSDEDFEKYGIFDKLGSIIGVKEDAPAEFKAAYEADKKMYEDARRQGIIL